MFESGSPRKLLGKLAPICCDIDFLNQYLPGTDIDRMATATPGNIPGRPTGSHRLASQARNIVLSVFKFFDKDSTEPVEDVMKKTSEATNVSLSVNKIYELSISDNKD